MTASRSEPGAAVADRHRDDAVWFKQRRLAFPLDAPALAALRAVPGVTGATMIGGSLRLSYDLRRSCLADLLSRLREFGGITFKRSWRVAFWSLTEDIQRQHQGRELDWDSLVRDSYMSQYQHRRHGRRDERPQHWRKYQAR